MSRSTETGKTQAETDEAFQALVNRAVDGDSTAQAALIAQFSSGLRALVSVWKDGATERADIVQMTWVQIFEALRDGRVKPFTARAFASLLATHARGLMSNAWRRRRRSIVITNDALYDQMVATATDEWWSGDLQLRVEAVQSAMNKLSDKDRQLLLMAAEGRTAKEIAERLGFGTTSNVHVRLTRARAKMRSLLADP